MIRHVAFPLILLTHRPPISVRACHADRICVPLQLEAARGRDTEGSTCRQRVGTDTLHAEGARSGAAAAALALQCSERRRCCGRYQEGFAEALWPDRRTHVRQLRKATPSAACVRSPFSAFPCVLTAVQCLSLCAHCRSVPFLVCSLPFSAFPCVLTAVQCLSLCAHCRSVPFLVFSLNGSGSTCKTACKQSLRASTPVQVRQLRAVARHLRRGAGWGPGSLRRCCQFADERAQLVEQRLASRLASRFTVSLPRVDSGCPVRPSHDGSSRWDRVATAPRSLCTNIFEL